MPWSTIAADEVLPEFTPQENASIQAIMGGTTNLASILARTVNSVRGSILGGGNQLDATNTIPDQLRGEVIAIARWKFLISLPQLKSLQTEARQKDYKAAQETIKDVSRKDSSIRIEPPAIATASTEPSPLNGIRVVSKTHRELKRRETRSL